VVDHFRHGYRGWVASHDPPANLAIGPTVPNFRNARGDLFGRREILTPSKSVVNFLQIAIRRIDSRFCRFRDIHSTIFDHRIA
jgi:hypothetical protein